MYPVFLIYLIILLNYLIKLINTVPVGTIVMSSCHLWTALFHWIVTNGPTYCRPVLIPVPKVPNDEILGSDDSSYH